MHSPSSGEDRGRTRWLCPRACLDWTEPLVAARVGLPSIPRQGLSSAWILACSTSGQTTEECNPTKNPTQFPKVNEVIHSKAQFCGLRNLYFGSRARSPTGTVQYTSVVQPSLTIFVLYLGVSASDVSLACKEVPPLLVANPLSHSLQRPSHASANSPFDFSTRSTNGRLQY
ncbi:hypothetical protein VTK56DRAFT_10009 [Thermocarpiscus australiensis]